MADTATRAAPRLVYPFKDKPAPGTTVEVAPGIRWVRMPMPFVLTHINLWLLEDGDGWTLVDTGLDIPDTRANWERVFATELGGRPITRVLCTHLHPDHIGLAGWMCARWNAPLWMSRTDYLMSRVLIEDTGRPAPEEGVGFYRAAGYSQEALELYKQRFGSFGRVISPLPQSYRRLVDGERFTIGEHEWEVVVGRGHAPEHACLYCRDMGVFVSGDQILPRISSIVSVFPTEPLANPLADWLESCRALKKVLSDDDLVLPAHNEPFRGAPLRLEQLIEEHALKLDSLYSFITEPKRAVDTFEALFKRRIDADSYSMATGEALAHLRWLEAEGKVSRTRDAAGVDWYMCV
jgi:glyoxylase-like metal-dependent hydrolase (beta-lactamase superfamily II)